MKCCQAKGVLVVPRWQTAMFWPIVHNGKTWQNGIELLLEYKNPKEFFQKGPFGNDVFSEKKFQSNVLILGVNFQVKM